MKNILILMKNTLKVTFRKKTSILVFLILPVVCTLIPMLLFGSSNRTVSIGINDNDKSYMTSDLVKFINKTENFKVSMVDQNEINDKIVGGKLDCVISIPTGFTDSVIAKDPKQIGIYSIKGDVSTAWIKSYADIYIRSLVDIAIAADSNKDLFEKTYMSYRQDDISLDEKLIENESNAKSKSVLNVGYLLIFIMLGANMTSEIILKDQRNRTFNRICTAPVKPIHYIIGNLMSNFLIILMQIIFVIFVAIKILKMTAYANVFSIVAILICFGLTSIAISMMVVSFSKSSNQSNILSTLILTPTCMLGGCFWPLSIMPQFVQNISNFTPQKWTIEAVSKLQAGGNFNQILANIGIILIFALIFIVIALINFSRRNDVKNFV